MKLVTIRSSKHVNIVARVPIEEAAYRVANEPFHYTTKSVWRRLRSKNTLIK